MECAFSQCTLVLGKLCTQLSDKIFHASLLLHSWDLAGILLELGQLTQCLRDSDEKNRKVDSAAKSRAVKQRRSHSNASVGPSHKRVHVTIMSDCDE